MHELTPDTTRVQSIDLAQEADFDLGLLRVRPASCEVEWNGVSQILQRRVMQVLVVLARAHGSVVSQSELVVRCWRGLSVSDDAIVRCISKLRKLAACYPEAPFAIETIPGVGYRLTSSGLVEHVPGSPRRRISRFRLRAWVAVAALCDPGGCVGGLDRSRPRCRRPSFYSRRGAAIRDIDNSTEVLSLARRIPTKSSTPSATARSRPHWRARRPAWKCTAGKSDTWADRDGNTARRWAATRLSISGSRDGASHAALWSMEFRRDSRQDIGLAAGSCCARRRCRQHRQFCAEHQSASDR